MNIPNVICLLSLLVFVACGTNSQNTSTHKKDDKQKVSLVDSIPEFNSDSAFSFVKKQVDFGPREPNSVAHDQCATWLTQKLKEYGSTVQLQEGTYTAHDKKQLDFTNIFASLNPNHPKRILITAHWDTRPWADNDADSQFHNKPIDGANDGASGVAVILELARIITKENWNIGVDFLLFDIEDYGVSSETNSFCYGSQYWKNHITYTDTRPLYGINLDMVGDKNASFSYEGFSNQYARHVLDKVWSSAHELGHKKIFTRKITYPVTDDHLYVNQAGIPCIDIIHRDHFSGRFPDTWHTHEDQIENISPKMLQNVGQTLLLTILKESKL